MTKQITIKVIKKTNDIIQGLRDANLTDGNYEILVNGEIYNVELINYYEDMVYELADGETSKTVSLGNNIADKTMLVVKYHKNLKVGEGVTLTATTRKKGMYVCVLGDLINEGEITMTARGANVEEGQNVYLWENIDSSYEYVPKDGAEGREAYKPCPGWQVNGQGKAGIEGEGRGTGSGGQGSYIINAMNGSANSWLGASTGGNSYSGGNGGGALVICNAPAVAASVTSATDSKGGNASAWDINNVTQYFAGGGAGITGGNSAYSRWGTAGSQTKGEDGTGGLLMLYADTLQNTGKISSEGSNGAGGTFAFNQRYNGAVGGAGSGGGTVNIFARYVKNAGEVSAKGRKRWSN